MKNAEARVCAGIAGPCRLVRSFCPPPSPLLAGGWLACARVGAGRGQARGLPHARREAGGGAPVSDQIWGAGEAGAVQACAPLGLPLDAGGGGRLERGQGRGGRVPGLSPGLQLEASAEHLAIVGAWAGAARNDKAPPACSWSGPQARAARHPAGDHGQPHRERPAKEGSAVAFHAVDRSNTRS